MHTSLAVILSLGVIALNSGCGGEQTPAAAAAAGLSGNWAGSFTPKSKAGLVAEPQEVNLSLGANDAFRVNLVKDLNSFAKGAYQNREKSKNIMFKVEESSFTDFAKSGNSIREFDYQMSDNELELNGEQGRYILVKQDEEDEKKDHAIEGEWECVTEDKATWNFVLDNPIFQGSRRAVDSKTIFFSGEIISITPDEEKTTAALLVINKCNVANKQGVKLRMTLGEQGRSTVQQVDEQGQQVESSDAIKCEKQ